MGDFINKKENTMKVYSWLNGLFDREIEVSYCIIMELIDINCCIIAFVLSSVS